MLECVLNVSEGRDPGVIAQLVSAAGGALLDVHSDADHHRSVLTMAGVDVERATRALTSAAVQLLDIGVHTGAHPRIGVVDVVPFVPLDGSTMAEAVAARNAFVTWAADALALPCFVYGPERSLPDVRRRAFTTLVPDNGIGAPHPTAGACAVGARPVLVAYNLWLADADLSVARAVAAAIRSPHIRALGLAVRDQVQVSCNLIDPTVVGPGAAYDAVAARAAVARAELVGLLPASVLAQVPTERWPELDLSPRRTIEARFQEAGLDGGSSSSRP